MPWDPEQYHKFQSSRFAPFEDMLSMLKVRRDASVIDLGCGTGELTSRLHDYLPQSLVTGIDSSESMLEKTGKIEKYGLYFKKMNLLDLEGEWDVVFSHAVLHWLGDHKELFRFLFSLLKEDGQLLVQIPANHNHPAHSIIRDIASKQPFASALGYWIHKPSVLRIEDYSAILFDCGAERIITIEKVYPLVMENGASISEWTKGSTLVPYLEKMPTELCEEFLAQYRRELTRLYPNQPVYYTFNRLLISAEKPKGKQI